MMPWETAPRNPSPPLSFPTTSSNEVFSPQQHQQNEEKEASLSISDQRTLYLVNIFIVNTARFLNRFSALCEEKLARLHRRILRLDASLLLLEAQLGGVGETEAHWRRSGPPEPSNAPVLQNHSSPESSCNPACQSGEPFSASFSVHEKSSTSSVDPEITAKGRYMVRLTPCRNPLWTSKIRDLTPIHTAGRR